ncbi:MAG TPA: OmpA family protein, partial [Polyangiales bacterium]|nr:OmpA family protein [Polyangiales bacterium]
HTDARGSQKHNRALSARRAESVVRWLVNHGIAAERLSAWGCGAERPIESNDSEAGRKANRRVEFHILRPPPEQAHDTQGCTEARGKVKRP